MSDRRRQALAFAVAALAGMTSTVLGLLRLETSAIGFSLSGALSGIASQASRTVPAGVAILGAAAANVMMGALVVRMLSRRPYDSVSVMVVHGLAGAVLVDALLLLGLGSVGMFRPAALIAVHIVVAAAAWIRGRPVFADPVRLRVDVSAPLFALVVLVWMAPVVLQLASPVVPFADVLPNHVAPVEHIRTFGSFAELTTVPSPIYGPSRSFLGYNGLLGMLSAITRVEAAQAVAAFALPLVIITALAAYNAARALFGDDVTPWALLTFPLTIAFLRISDLRSSVLALPIAVAVVSATTSSTLGASSLAVLLAAAIVVHPIVGGLAWLTIAVVCVIDARRRTTLLLVLATALAAATPQALTVLGVPAPSWTALAAVPLAVGVWFTIKRLRVPAAVMRLARRVPVLIVLVVTVVGLRFAGELASGVRDTFGDVMRFPLLGIGGVAAFVLTARRTTRLARSALVSAVLAPFAVASLARVFASGPDLWRSARWEIASKSVEFWIPLVFALAAAAGAADLWERGTFVWRVPVLAFVVVAAFPFATRSLDLAPLEEARYSESLAIALHHAEDGYWIRYPHARDLIDRPREEIVEAIRDEQNAGRIHAGTEVLHVSDSFQQWDATPLAPFTGVLETSVSNDPERSVHTIGGRLFHIDDLESLLGPRFDYVVVEGRAREAALEDIRRAGYRSVYSNERGSVLSRTRA